MYGHHYHHRMHQEREMTNSNIYLINDPLLFCTFFLSILHVLELLQSLGNKSHQFHHLRNP
jgi:hypothetical protein